MRSEADEGAVARNLSLSHNRLQSGHERGRRQSRHKRESQAFTSHALDIGILCVEGSERLEEPRAELIPVRGQKRDRRRIRFEDHEPERACYFVCLLLRHRAVADESIPVAIMRRCREECTERLHGIREQQRLKL
ncbi:MAG TPA: hypothetical protein VMF67_16855 [Rhizomicrobium sp.]|nr:hypothetical protein [Rhizomicrobium sp.]